MIYLLFDQNDHLETVYSTISAAIGAKYSIDCNFLNL